MTLDARLKCAVGTSGDDRLREEITRELRMMTDELSAAAPAECVPAPIPYAADHFRDELVRTPAGGDANLLVDLSAA